MRLKISLFLLLAAVLAFCAGVVSFLYLGEVDRELRAARSALAVYGETETVPVLQRDIRAADAIFPEDFVDFEIPRSYLPENALRSRPVLAEGEVLIAINDLAKGELLLNNEMAVRTSGETSGLPLRLADGKVAGIVPVTNLADLRQVLTVGALVDVFLHQRNGPDAGVRLVASGLEILRLPEAPDAKTPQPVIAPGPSNVVLTAQPVEIGRLLLAAQGGDLHLVLSSGPRAAEEGVVLIGASELANLPVALRSVAGQGPGHGGLVQAGVRQPVEVIPTAPVAAPPSLLPSSSGCSTTVVRASQRVQIDVPC